MKLLAMAPRCGNRGCMNVNKTLFSRLIVQALAGFDSENKLAEALGVAPNSIRNWRLGLTTPQKKVAREVCEKLGVPLESILNNRAEALGAGISENRLGFRQLPGL